MDEKDLQEIQSDIERKRLEIEQEIEAKKRQVEEEIAARRKEMEQKLSDQRAEMDRRHQEQIRLMNRQVNARDLAAKIEAEFLAGKEKVEAKVKTDSMSISSASGLTDDAEALMNSADTVKQPLPEEGMTGIGVNEADEETLAENVPEFFPIGDTGGDERNQDGTAGKETLAMRRHEPQGEGGIFKFVKNLFHKETLEEIAQDIAKKEKERLASEEKEKAKAEKIEQERIAREKAELEERERQEREQQEREEQERQERLAAEKAEQERLTQKKAEQGEIDRLARVRAEQIAKKREKNKQNKFFRKREENEDEKHETISEISTIPAENEAVKEKSQGGWLRMLLFVIAAIIIAATFFYGTVFVVKHIVSATNVGVVYPRAKVSNESGEVIEGVLTERINVLVLGTDYGDSEADKDDPKRTDAMLLVSVDPQKDSVAVLSIPRDTKVVLPGHRNFQKINAAYAFGGVMMAKQAVANLLGVPITHYALADWKAFTATVDLIGGVDILVEHDMKYDDPYANLHIDIKKGYQHLDGKLAGQYVRYRSDELGDIGRTQRQQLFIRSAVKQMFSVGNIVKIPSILKAMSDYVETDMTFVTMLKVMNSVKMFGEKNIKTGTLYGECVEENDVSYWQTDESAIRRTLRELDVPSSKVK